MSLPAFGSSWTEYDFSGGTTPVDYILKDHQQQHLSQEVFQVWIR